MFSLSSVDLLEYFPLNTLMQSVTFYRTLW